MTLDIRSFERLADSVRWTEQQFTARAEHPGGEFAARVAVPVLAVASEDIEHNTFGDASLSTGSFTSTSATSREIEVYNPGLKVWDTSDILVRLVGIPGTSSQKYVILQAFSATRLRGTASSTIAPGSSGTLTSVDAINGMSPGSTVTVKNLTGSGVTISSGDLVAADLCWDISSSGVSEWVSDAWEAC